MIKVRGWLRRFRSSRGATIPEYAMLLGAFAVISFAGIENLRDESDDELTETSECIGQLPSDAGCGVGVD
jgi:hypothetical protein